MKSVLFLFASVFFVASITQAGTKNITGKKAQELLQALHQSGVELVETSSGFKTLEPVSVACKGSREHRISGGILRDSPECYQKANRVDDYEFVFDKKLVNTVSLISALDEAGADADAAMGKYYISAKNIDCTFTISPRKVKCSLEVTQ